MKFLTLKNVADLMGKSRATIWRRVKAGKIKANKIGKSYFVSEKDLPGIYKILNKSEKDFVKTAVEKVVQDYGETLKKLGKT